MKIIATPLIVLLTALPSFAQSAEMEPLDDDGGFSLLSSTNAFVEFTRDPAETLPALVPSTYVVMPLDGTSTRMAYFRDRNWGARTDHTSPSDGDEFTMQATRPDGAIVTFDTITFHASYLGHPNCWVNNNTGGGFCGATAIRIHWFSRAQCEPSGTWSTRYYYNGAIWHTAPFNLYPRIPPNAVPSFNQGDSAWASNHYNRACRDFSSTLTACTAEPPNPSVETPVTVQQRGCYMAAIANLMKYHGVSTNPGLLNTAGRALDVDGLQVLYKRKGIVNPTGVTPLSGTKDVRFLARREGFSLVDPSINALICHDGPQILHITDHHFVTVTGRDGLSATSDFIFNNPDGGGVDQTLGTVFTPQGWRLYSGGWPTPANDGNVDVTAQSPVDVLITDPQGRRVGVDSTAIAYDEIPDGDQGRAGLRNNVTMLPEGPIALETNVPHPTNGRYLVKLTGTGSGVYALDMTAQRTDGTSKRVELVDIVTAPGLVHLYAFDYALAAGSTITFYGGFDGGLLLPETGQTNRLLTYVTPFDSVTTLPSGTTAVTVIIAYGAGIVPASFTAMLNDVDVTSMFSPAAGTYEDVTIPLSTGQNALILSIDGPGGLGATDRDVLEFVVP